MRAQGTHSLPKGALSARQTETNTRSPTFPRPLAAPLAALGRRFLRSEVQLAPEAQSGAWKGSRRGARPCARCSDLPSARMISAWRCRATSP
jgi:hypothetical protein